ncbi:hypothetical protein [Streptomyces sp. NPDC017940]|uniref:hypothetical protein n=1 Tax=Streptomyces sp. NPDC017940 TaxID=3365017 RepID=UPI003789D0C3
MSTVAIGASKAAGTAAGKALSSRSGRVQFAGREERRQVYYNYSRSAMRLFTEVDILRSYGPARLWALRQTQRGRFTPLLADLFNARNELITVCNPQPGWACIQLEWHLEVAVGRFWLDGYYDRDIWRETNDMLALYLMTVRHDLVNVPRLWQIWRPEWWKLRAQSRRTEKKQRKKVEERMRVEKERKEETHRRREAESNA